MSASTQYCKGMGSRLSRCPLAAMFAVLIVVHISDVAAADEQVDFNRDIRPILSENCFACHGNDAKHRKAKLRLDQREDAIRLNSGIAAIVPGSSRQSEAYLLIATKNPDDRMPPVKSGKALTPEQIELVKRWIDQGAKYGKHWAFVKPQRAPLPPVRDKHWPRQAIDYFVLAKLDAKGLKPSPPADRYRLVRRVYLDLIGLPPTPAEADAFAQDESADAYEKVVNRLLASPRFGERWAQVWLDLARYADTMGYEKDLPRNIWAYRDWVIDALNRDMPFDQFTVEQLAGDLLPNARNDQILATAFHRNTLTNQEGGTDDEEFRVLAVKDRVDTTVQVWMGLTMGCAKCHSHKYDPITQEEYYKFFAYFNQTEDRDLGSDAPKIATVSPGQRAEIEALETQLTAWHAKAAAMAAGLSQKRAAWEEQQKTAGQWSVVTPIKPVSVGGATLTVKPDGSVLASGKSPQRDTYTFSAQVAPGTYTAVRIEALTDASLGRQGPGRNARDPNYVVNAFVVTMPGRANAGEAATLSFSKARADYSQKNWSVQGAIDGNPKTGWAISSQFGKPHTAIFDLKEPLELQADTTLQFRIEQNYGQSLTLGRFRVSLTTAPPSTLSTGGNHIAKILAIDPAKRSASEQQTLTLAFLRQQASANALLAGIADAQKRLDAARAAAPVTPIMKELADNRRRTTHIHKRGNFMDKGEAVQPGIPATFGPLPAGSPQNRLGVAKWLVHSDNPLTARVQVNRFWARLFGTGLVLTEEDFGNQGMVPTHPHVLDYLAVDFVANGWSVKQLLRTLVTSATYRQSSNVSEALHKADPNNQWLARGPRFRLEAEIVRDQALAVGGLLSAKMFGPSVMPPQPDGVWKITYSGSKWVNATGEDRYRRGLYTFWRRTSPYPSMLTFDAGTREVCTVRRVRTNTPLQSLVTLNDPVYVEAAGGLAKRVMAEGGADDKTRAAYAFRLAAVRPADAAELQRVLAIYDTARKHFAGAPDQAAELIKSAGQVAPKDVAAEHFAAWIVVGNMLLNLDEVMTKG